MQIDIAAALVPFDFWSFADISLVPTFRSGGWCWDVSGEIRSKLNPVPRCITTSSAIADVESNWVLCCNAG